MWKDARCESRSFFCRTLPRTTTVPHRTQTEPSPYPYKSQIVHYTLCDYTFDISTSGLINIFNCTSSIKKGASVRFFLHIRKICSTFAA